jgi:autotransporter-associated beta strand protein
MVGALADTLFGQTLTITNGIQTYVTLTSTTVTMSNRCELRVTGTNNPIAGSIINLNSPDAWFFLPNIRPSVVSASYLGQVRVNGAAAAAGTNCRLDQYAMGSVIIPQSPGFSPLQVFTGPNFIGASAQFGIYTYYNTPGALGVMNRNIGSFKLKRGYSATFAQSADGTGISKVFVAQDGDLDVGIMAAELDHACSFLRVIPWRWTSKKGYGGGDGATTICEPLWFYDWGDGSTSTLDREFIPIKWDETGNYNNINNKQKSTQVLGYNEPDSCSQANISVADALAIWPSLMQSGLRVGAPAVSDSGLAGEGLDWLYNFMNQATNRGYRVDYIPIHWYKCGQSAASFSNYLYTVYQKYGRPIWVTEWNNGASWCQGDISYATSATTISNFINMLESAPFVERYAIYPWWSDTSGLAVVTNSVLTPVGVVYRNKQSALAYTQTLPAGGSRSIAQFHFETDTDDSSGYGNNGFAVGVPGFANGQIGQAVALDGTNGFIRLPPNVANGAEFSFAGWVYWNGGASWQRIFDFGDDATHYLFLTPSSGSGTLRFAVNGGSGEQIVQTTGPLPSGLWQHVAFTLSSGIGRLYTNGVLAASASITITPSNLTPALNYLGKSQFSADPLFSGSLDEVQIADYAFTAAQVASLMTNTAPQFTTNLVAGGSATPGVAYSGSIAGTATDTDPGDLLIYSKAGGPAWLAVAPDGTLSGTPGIYDVATNNFTVRATDTAGASAFAVLTIALPNIVNNGTWNTDADGNWTDTSKWSGSLPASGAGVTADFSTLSAGANRTTTLDNARSVGTLKFGTRNWNLSASGGSVLTLENSSLTSPSIVVNQNTATIAAPLAGWNGFTKSGAGTLILAANNPVTGVLNIDTGSTTASDGIVRAAHPAALANVSAIRLRNNSGASAGSTFQLDGSAGGITLNAPIALNGRNAAVVSIENIAGNNTLNGDIAINVGGGNYWLQSDAGLLTLGGVITPLATGSRTITFQGAGNFSITGFLENGCATTVSVVKSGAGTLTLNSVNSYTGGTTVNGGTVNLARGGSSGTVRNILTINSGATVNLTATDALGYTNGGSGVTFVSTANIVGGTLNNSVNGNNGFSTKFNLTGGTMSSTGGGAYNLDGATGAGISSLASATVSAVSGNVALRSVGVVFSTAQGSVPSGIDLNISGAISGAFPIIKSGAGTLSLSGVNTYSGPTTISAGTLLINGAGRLGGGTYAANITNNGTFNYNSSQAQTLSGVHSGTGALIQSGPGTLTLSGANTYSGNTAINGGKLALGNGVTLPNTPLISIAAGGTLDVSVSGLTLGPAQTLKGNGTVLGSLTVNGTLAPGASIGVLTASNNVTLGIGSTNIFEISKTPLTNDQLLVSGMLTYGGTLVVTNLAGTLAVGDSFQLFNASGTSGVFAATNLPSLPAGLAWQWTPASGVLSVISTVALNPTNLAANLSGDILQLSWPADHTGWRMETNAADIADPNAWFTLDGSTATNQVFIPIDSASGHVFFRLAYP